MAEAKYKKQKQIRRQLAMQSTIFANGEVSRPSLGRLACRRKEAKDAKDRREYDDKIRDVSVYAM
jgi:hypothetical protein